MLLPAPPATCNTTRTRAPLRGASCRVRAEEGRVGAPAQRPRHQGGHQVQEEARHLRGGGGQARGLCVCVRPKGGRRVLTRVRGRQGRAGVRALQHTWHQPRATATATSAAAVQPRHRPDPQPPTRPNQTTPHLTPNHPTTLSRSWKTRELRNVMMLQVRGPLLKANVTCSVCAQHSAWPPHARVPKAAGPKGWKAGPGVGKQALPASAPASETQSAGCSVSVGVGGGGQLQKGSRW